MLVEEENEEVRKKERRSGSVSVGVENPDARGIDTVAIEI